MPTGPGVYVMRDGAGATIYVGKAANLRSRMRSYFGSPTSMEGKTRLLSEAIADFEYVVTHTEQEALHLEAALVKRHQPLFNVRLKDDKHYPYLKVDLADPWPRVYITRRVTKDGARYFGPFANAGSVRRTLDIVNKLFPWRSCTKTITGTDPRPCLDYFIHRCIAPCTSYCTKEEYDEVIRQVILFLEGRTEEVVRSLKREMKDASAAMEYERAGRVRDQIESIERVTERQTVASTKASDEDVFGLARGEGDAVVQVLFVRGVKMVGVDSFTLDGAKDETDGDVMASFIKQFYESATYIPRRIVVPVVLPERELIESWLTERRDGKVELLVPQRGEKRRLVEMAAKNARESLDMARVKWLADRGKTQTALTQLQDELDLPAPPAIEGAEAKSGADDESFAALPDLVIIDGGKGQLSAVLDVMRDMGVKHIPTVGLAKQHEEIYVQDVSDPIVLPRASEALYLVQRIRDEAHRFAVTYHRGVRSKAGMQSVLDTVPGVGPKRRKALIKKFGSVRGIREASVDEIASTVGFTAALAEKVKAAI